MADDNLEIIIRSKGGETVVASFKNISTGAQQMGVTTEQAAQKASRSTDDFSKRMAALGAVATTTAAILGQWSRSSQDAAAIQRGLEAAIGATGESFDQYADRVQAAGERAVQLGIDDEAASQAISALTQITGSANIALDNMGLVMDLAAAKGMSLESAAELVGKVHEGNTAILQRYGIVVEKGATAEEALAQIQAQVTGQAEAHATGYARIREEISNLTDSIGGAVGGFAPFLSLLPGVSSGISLAGAATGAFSGLLVTQTVASEGAAAAELERAAATEVATASTVAAEVASGGLLAVLGPIGLVAAAAAAAFGVYKLVQGHDDEAEAAKAADEATKDLVTTLHDLAAAGSPGAGAAAAFAAVLTQSIASASEQLADVQRQIDEITQGGDTTQPVAGATQAEADALQTQLDALLVTLAQLQAVTGEGTDAQIALAATFRDTGVGADLAQQRIDELFAAFAASPKAAADIKVLDDGIIWVGTHLGNYDETANAAAAASRQLAIDSAGAADAFDVLGKAVADIGNHYQSTAEGQKVLADLQVIATEGTDAQRAAVQRSWEEAQKGTKEYALFANTVALYANTARAAAKAADETADAFARASDRQAAYQESLSASIAAAQEDRVRAFANATDRQVAAQQQQSDTMAGYAEEEIQQAKEVVWANDQKTFSLEGYFAASLKAADGTDSLTDAQRKFNEANKQEAVILPDIVQQAKDRAKATYDYATALGVLDSVAERLHPVDMSVTGGDRVTGTAASVEQAASAFASSTGVIIDQTEAISGNIDAIGDWAVAMLPAEDEIGKLQDLLDRGIITQAQYAAGTKYATQILADNARAQDATAKINARQIPFIEAQTQAYTEQLEALAELPPAEARVALGFMDANESMKAQQAIALATAAANGELGDKSEETATKIIEGAIAADPILEGMLTDIGLVARDHEGNLVVNFPAADSLNQAVDGLTTSINLLRDALIILDTQDATPQVTLAGGDIAAQTLMHIGDLMSALDGDSITSTVNLVTNNISNDIQGVASKLNLHGGVAGYALGGMTRIIAGEAGYELLDFANGGQAIASTYGTYNVPVGTMVTPHPASAAKMGGGGGVQIEMKIGTVNGFGDLDAFFAAAAQAARAHFAGMGV